MLDDTVKPSDGDIPALKPEATVDDPPTQQGFLRSTGSMITSLFGLRGLLFQWLEKERRQPVKVPPEEAVRAEKLRVPVAFLALGAIFILGALAAKDYLPAPRPDTDDKLWQEIGTLFVAELGVALIVAFCVAWGVDRRARLKEVSDRAKEAQALERKREAERLENLAREQKLVEDVFSGVLGIRHSSNYVRKVIETTLERRVVRRSVDLFYSLKRIEGNEAERMSVESGRFMMLDQVISFSLQNLSTDDEKVDIVFTIPVRHGRKLRDESHLYAISIGGEPVKIEEKVSGEGQPNDARVYEWLKWPILQGARLSVSAKLRVVKEESDTEVWCSYFPCTEGVTINVSAPPGLRMGIRNNTASTDKMETDPCDNGIGVWKIDGPILPNDSVVFFWRTPEDDGDDAPPQKVEGVSQPSKSSRESQFPVDEAGAMLPSVTSAAEGDNGAVEQSAADPH